MLFFILSFTVLFICFLRPLIILQLSKDYLSAVLKRGEGENIGGTERER